VGRDPAATRGDAVGRLPDDAGSPLRSVARASDATLLHRVLHVAPALDAEARGAFLYLALSVPFVVLSLSLRAILEAAQRFDLVNLIRTPSGAVVFVVPAVALCLAAACH